MKYIKYYFQTLPILSFEMHTLRVARALKSVKWKCALYGFGTIYIIVILYSHSLVKALWYLYFTYQTEVKSCLFLFCLLRGKMHCVNCPKGGPWPSTSRLINLYAYFSKVAREFIRFLMNVHQNRNFSAFQYMFQLYWAINLYAKFSKSRDVYTSIYIPGMSWVILSMSECLSQWWMKYWIHKTITCKPCSSLSDPGFSYSLCFILFISNSIL